MEIKLVPVIELQPISKGDRLPDGPYSEFPLLWDKFHESGFRRDGYVDKLVPFESGGYLYELDKISDNNLKKVIEEHTKEFRIGAYERYETSPLLGGYVLQVDHKNLFYPQCCGDLGDIQFWRNISQGRESYYEGHPTPNLSFHFDKIVFDLNVEGHAEEFVPIPVLREFTIQKDELKKAVEETELKLETFGTRIAKINLQERLKINRIEDLLIWENLNY